MRCDVDQSDEEYGAVVRKNAARDPRRGNLPVWSFPPLSRCPAPSPLAAYDAEEEQPSPYMFFMQDNDFTLFGASPEKLAGTMPSAVRLRSTPSPAPGRAAAAPTFRWIAISTAVSNWKCVPITKSFQST